LRGFCLFSPHSRQIRKLTRRLLVFFAWRVLLIFIGMFALLICGVLF